jgi:hypothetical protein
MLLKDTNGALPLKAPNSLAVFGNDAGDVTQGSSNQFDIDYGTLAVGRDSDTGRIRAIVSNNLPIVTLQTTSVYSRSMHHVLDLMLARKPSER